MMKMGFCPIWVKWILNCVTTAAYSFNVNGQKVGYVKPSRGIRQGDPLSPYLFLICAEGLSNLMNQRLNSKALTGVKVGKECPMLSHLLFADDSLFCCKASIQEAEQMKGMFAIYERASGQAINYENSAVFFSANTNKDLRKTICPGLGNMKEAASGKYLGLPMMIGRSKQQALQENWSSVTTFLCDEKKLSQKGILY
mgnify:CR=1 FL=1